MSTKPTNAAPENDAGGNNKPKATKLFFDPVNNKVALFKEGAEMTPGKPAMGGTIDFGDGPKRVVAFVTEAGSTNPKTEKVYEKAFTSFYERGAKTGEKDADGKDIYTQSKLVALGSVGVNKKGQPYLEIVNVDTKAKVIANPTNDAKDMLPAMGLDVEFQAQRKAAYAAAKAKDAANDGEAPARSSAMKP